MVSREYGVSKNCRRSRKCVAWGARERCAQDGVGAVCRCQVVQSSVSCSGAFLSRALEDSGGSGEGWLARVVLLGGEGQDRHTESCLETVNLLFLV